MSEHEKRLEVLKQLRALPYIEAAMAWGAFLAEHRAEVESLAEEKTEAERFRDSWRRRWSEDVGTARDAALEEAADVAHAEALECKRLKRSAEDMGVTHARQSWQAAEASAEGVERTIRALKSQPARQYVDVEKVRGVLVNMRDDALGADREATKTRDKWYARAVADTCIQAAANIGVGLDAEGACECGAIPEPHEEDEACNLPAEATPSTPQVIAAARNAAGLPPLDTRQTCTCTGACRGPDGLGVGWKCALEMEPQ